MIKNPQKHDARVNLIHACIILALWHETNENVSLRDFLIL